MNLIIGHSSLSLQFTVSDASHFRWPLTILSLNEFIMVKTHTIFIHFFLITSLFFLAYLSIY